MNRGSSEQVRAVAVEKYVKPALEAGKTHFSVAVKDLMQELASQGFPPANTPQVCTALRKKEFLRTHGIEIEAIDGPRSKISTTVVYRYRVQSKPLDSAGEQQVAKGEESPEEWAHRMTGKLFGLLKDELAEYGGSESFMRWVRSDDKEAR
jgi:hypothetical protein